VKTLLIIFLHSESTSTITGGCKIAPTNKCPRQLRVFHICIVRSAPDRIGPVEVRPLLNWAFLKFATDKRMLLSEQPCFKSVFSRLLPAKLEPSRSAPFQILVWEINTCQITLVAFLGLKQTFYSICFIVDISSWLHRGFPRIFFFIGLSPSIDLFQREFDFFQIFFCWRALPHLSFHRSQFLVFPFYSQGDSFDLHFHCVGKDLVSEDVMADVAIPCSVSSWFPSFAAPLFWALSFMLTAVSCSFFSWVERYPLFLAMSGWPGTSVEGSRSRKPISF